MTRSAAATVDQHPSYPSAWDGRPDPVDITLLGHRRKDALEHYDRVRERLDELRARVAKGRGKIKAAQKADMTSEEVRAAERKLAGLEADLDDLRLSVELPCHVLEAAKAVADDLSALGCPQGSVLSFDL